METSPAPTNPVTVTLAAATIVTASFAIDTFTLTYSAGSGGTISGTTPQTVNVRASGSTVTAVPNTGYHFVGWSDGVLTASRTDTNVTADHTVSASFAIDTFTLAYSAGSGGTISGTTPQTVNYGASGSTVTAVPNTGYHFVGWSDGVLTASRTDTGVTANHTVSASFAIDTFTITATAGANGTISPAGAQTVDYGGSQTFTITPATGYHVADVLVDGNSVGPVTGRTFTNVTANHTISASFAIDAFTITATAGANGTISPAGTQTLNYGGSQAFTITPATGYHVADVLVDGNSVGPVTGRTFTNVTANHTISASFAIDTFTITPTAGANGSITPGTAQTIEYGGSQTFTITPATGYHIADVLVDGNSVGPVTSYPFTTVTANHTVSATFAIDTFTITATAGANGTHQSRRRPDPRLRRQPDLHHHARYRLPRRRCARRRQLGGAGDQLSVRLRHRQPHDQRQLRDRHLYDHSVGRVPRLHQPLDAADPGVRRQSDLHHRARRRLLHRRRARRR